MIDFESLRASFRRYFIERYGYAYPSASFRGDGRWEYAVVYGTGKYNGCIHYELMSEPEGCFLDLHVEIPSSQVPEWESLNQAMIKRIRLYSHSSYYSQNYWRTRTPVTDEAELISDLDRMVSIVEPIFCHTVGFKGNDKKYDSPGKILSLVEVGRRTGLRIPPVQRGLVWKAVQAEVLWDSILRGFPIGTFSLKRTEEDGCYDLMDGQQRTNAISMAFDFDETPTKKVLARTHELLCCQRADVQWQEIAPAMKSVLWIDLLPGGRGAAGEKRKYHFKVTTAANPWGYGNGGDEKANDIFNASAKSSAFRLYCQRCGLDAVSTQKPLPYEFWPVKAGFPVPFNAVVEFCCSGDWCEKYRESTVEDFSRWCSDNPRIKEANWLNHNGIDRLSNDDLSLANRNWKDIVARISERLWGEGKYCVVGILANNVSEDDVGLFFERMNKSGTVPDDEEIQYSLLKDKLKGAAGVGRAVWDQLDRHASNLGISGARLLNIVLRYLLARKNNELQGRAIATNVVLSMAETLKAFVSDEKCGLFELIRKANLLYGRHGVSVRWMLSEVAKESDGVALTYLLNILQESNCTWEGTVPGLFSYLIWFSNDLENTIRLMWLSKNDLVSAIYKSIRSGYLEYPVEPSEIDDMLSSFKCGDMESCLKELNARWNDPLLKGRIKKVWYGFVEGEGFGKSLLMFASRKYLDIAFPGYEPGQPQWFEQNTPWDYDHLLPQSWLNEESCGDDYAFYKDMVWSVGNSAPIPFQINRSRGNRALWDNYPYPTGSKGVPRGLLHLEKIDFDCFKENEKEDVSQWFADCHKQRILSLFENLLGRFRDVYLDWYDTLRIEEFLKVEDCLAYKNDSRRNVMMKLSGYLAGIGGRAYFVSGMKEIPLDNVPSWRWATPWVSFGVPIVYGSEEIALAAVSAWGGDSRKWEYGIRKGPSLDSANAEYGEKLHPHVEDGKGWCPNPVWWYFYRTKNLNPNDIEGTANILASYIKKYNEWAGKMNKVNPPEGV